MKIGTYYVRVSERDEREKLVKTLESDGLRIDEDFKLSRQDILESNLPITVDLMNSTYSRMGNVTCAAGAASSGCIISVEEFFAESVEDDN